MQKFATFLKAFTRINNVLVLSRSHEVKLLILMVLSCVLSLSANAKDMQFDHYINMPYSEVRTDLINEGWQIVKNKQIEDSSLYAEGIFEQGYEEVLDCISMERDQCQFVLRKNKQHILITTKEKTLNVESIETKN
jgi:hypothetical protein